MTVEPVHGNDGTELMASGFDRPDEMLAPEVPAAFGNGKRGHSMHLLSTEANATRLKRSIAELDAGHGLELPNFVPSTKPSSAPRMVLR